MPADEAEVRMSGDDADAHRMWQRQFADVEKMHRKLGQLGQSGAGDRLSQGFERSLMKVIALDRVIGMATQGIRRFVEEERRLQKEFGQQQRSYGQSFSRAAEAVGATNQAELEDLDRRIQSIAAKTGAEGGAGAIAEDVATATSAKGKLPGSRVLETTEAAADLRPTLPREDRNALIGGALELQKGYPDMSAEESVARVLEGYITARTGKLGAFAKNIAPAVANLRAFGGGKDDFDFIESLMVGIGQRSGDDTGEKTRTSATAFMQQLKERTAPFVAADATSEEQLTFLQSDAPEAVKLRQQLLGPLAREAQDLRGKAAKDPGNVELKGEAAQKVALMELLSKDSETWKQILKVREELAKTHKEAVAKIRANREALRNVASQEPLNVDVGMRGAAEGLRLLDIDKGVKGTLSEKLTETLEGAGADLVDRARAQIKLYVQGKLGGVDAAYGVVEEEIQAELGRDMEVERPEMSQADRAAREALLQKQLREVQENRRRHRQRVEAQRQEEARHRQQQHVMPDRVGFREEVQRAQADPALARRLIDEVNAARGLGIHPADAIRLDAVPEEAPQVLNEVIDPQRFTGDKRQAPQAGPPRKRVHEMTPGEIVKNLSRVTGFRDPMTEFADLGQAGPAVRDALLPWLPQPPATEEDLPPHVLYNRIRRAQAPEADATEHERREYDRQRLRASAELRRRKLPIDPPELQVAERVAQPQRVQPPQQPPPRVTRGPVSGPLWTMPAEAAPEAPPAGGAAGSSDAGLRQREQMLRNRVQQAEELPERDGRTLFDRVLFDRVGQRAGQARQELGEKILPATVLYNRVQRAEQTEEDDPQREEYLAEAQRAREELTARGLPEQRPRPTRPAAEDQAAAPQNGARRPMKLALPEPSAREASQRPAVALADPELKAAVQQLAAALSGLPGLLQALPGEVAQAIASTPQRVALDLGQGRPARTGRKAVEGFNNVG